MGIRAECVVRLGYGPQSSVNETTLRKSSVSDHTFVFMLEYVPPKQNGPFERPSSIN